MKKFTKFMGVAMALIMLLALCACGGSTASESTGS